MDAYDLYKEIERIWCLNVDKNSGQLLKNGNYIPVTVNNKEVVGIQWDSTNKRINLELRD